MFTPTISYQFPSAQSRGALMRFSHYPAGGDRTYAAAADIRHSAIVGEPEYPDATFGWVRKVVIQRKMST